jgi:hypothetical protein
VVALQQLISKRLDIAMQNGILPLTLVNAFTSSGETNSRYWFAKVMRTRSAHGYRLAERNTDGRRLQAHPYLKLPLLVVLILGVDPLLRVHHPTFEILRTEWHEASDEKCNSILDEILGKGWRCISENKIVDGLGHSLKLCSVFAFRAGDHWARLSLNITIPATRIRTGNTAVSESRRYLAAQIP